MWLLVLAACLEVEVKAHGKASVVAGAEPGAPGSLLYAQAEDSDQGCRVGVKCSKEARCPLWCALQLVRDRAVKQVCRPPPGPASSPSECAEEDTRLQQLIQAKGPAAAVQERAKACLKKSASVDAASVCFLTHEVNHEQPKPAEGEEPTIDLAPGDYMGMDLASGIHRIQEIREWNDAEGDGEDAAEDLTEKFADQQLHLDHLPTVKLVGSSEGKTSLICSDLKDPALTVMPHQRVILEQLHISGCGEAAVVHADGTLVMRGVKASNLALDGIRLEQRTTLQLYGTTLVAREDGIVGSARMDSARDDYLSSLQAAGGELDAVSRALALQSEEAKEARERAQAWKTRGVANDDEEEAENSGEAYNNIKVQIMEQSRVQSGEDGLSFRGRACRIEMDHSTLVTSFYDMMHKEIKADSQELQAAADAAYKEKMKVAKNAAGDGVILGENSQFIGNYATIKASEDGFALDNNAQVTCIECTLSSSATDDEFIDLAQKANAGDHATYAERVAPGSPREDADGLVLLNFGVHAATTLTFGARYVGPASPGEKGQLFLRDIEGSGVRDAVLSGLTAKEPAKAKALAAAAGLMAGLV